MSLSESTGTPKLDFVVSYTSPDRQWAECIAGVLEDSGYKVFV